MKSEASPFRFGFSFLSSLSFASIHSFIFLLNKMAALATTQPTGSSSNHGILQAATDYVAWDPNPETRQAIATLLAAQDVDKLQALLGSRLAFGTAGLRGAMG
jgi:hypothetical protein